MFLPHTFISRCQGAGNVRCVFISATRYITRKNQILPQVNICDSFCRFPTKCIFYFCKICSENMLIFQFNNACSACGMRVLIGS
jgi:hypothetical protein